MSEENSKESTVSELPKHRHHIVPRHSGGQDTDGNLTAPITVKEHAELHRQLWEKNGDIRDLTAWKALAARKTQGVYTVDFTGRRFGKLIVVSRVRENGITVYFCACDCGNKTKIRHSNIRIAKSCGCYRMQVLRSVNIRHGKSHQPTWRSWKAMMDRCINENLKDFQRYGARGITVCERWKKFENFLSDMGERPIGKTLDRENNDGNYEPGNCQWATPTQQSNNKRNNRFIEFGGKRLTVAEWARVLAISPELLVWRMSHWSVERAFTTNGIIRRRALHG